MNCMTILIVNIRGLIQKVSTVLKIVIRKSTQYLMQDKADKFSQDTINYQTHHILD